MWALTKGLRISDILPLTFDQWDSLHASLKRVDAARLEDEGWAMMVATQGTPKELESMCKKRRPRDTEDEAPDAKEFLRKYGKGI